MLECSLSVISNADSCTYILSVYAHRRTPDNCVGDTQITGNPAASAGNRGRVCWVPARTETNVARLSRGWKKYARKSGNDAFYTATLLLLRLQRHKESASNFFHVPFPRQRSHAPASILRNYRRCIFITFCTGRYEMRMEKYRWNGSRMLGRVA